MITPAQRAAARRHHRSQRRITIAAVRAAIRAWRRIDLGAAERSWERDAVGQELVRTAIAGKLAAAQEARPYLDAMVGRPTGPVPRLLPRSLTTEAADGRELDDLMFRPVVRALQVQRQGALIREAYRAGELALARIVANEVANAGRTADQIEMATRPQVAGYIRLLTPPSCGRCVVLAGRIYKWSDGFERHPQCFPAGVAVSGPGALAATRRWYEGELAVIRTASGEELPATGNHPVLTDRGWVPANLLDEGDHLVRSTRGEGATPLVVPDVRLVPTAIEQVAGTLGVGGLHRMPAAAEHFHGDGLGGEVDVVLADRELRDGLDAAFGEQLAELLLRGGDVGGAGLDALRATEEFLLRALAAPNGLVGSSGLSGALLGTHLGRAHEASGGAAAHFDVGLVEAASDHRATDAEALADGVLALASEVSQRDLVRRHVAPLGPRWDAPPGPLSMENAAGYARQGADLLGRLASQVELDRVVEVRRVDWSGHVYNLTSREGWYSANGLIVSNCDCTHVPVSEAPDDEELVDPAAAVRAGQVRGLPEADREAILAGADPGQVINAHRGMYTLDGLAMTTAGTTKRGFAAANFRARTGRRISRRLRPAAIFRIADGDRDEALRLLTLHGYIV